MMERLRFVCVSVFAGPILAAFVAASSAEASTVLVGTGKSGLRQYSTIQAAVDAAPAASIIQICPGTYHEQVTISGKKLTLTGIQVGTSDAAV